MDKETATHGVDEALLAGVTDRRHFLLRFADELRMLDDPIAIQETACRMLGEYLGANRVMYVDVEGEEFIPGPMYEKDVVPFPPVRNHILNFATVILEACLRGETVSIEDVQHDPRIMPAEAAAWRSIGVAAVIAVMLIKRGRIVGSFGIHSSTPRKWSGTELELAREVADRIWTNAERARAEAALRESEQRYRTIFETMVEGYGLMEIIRDEKGRAVDVRYLESNARFEQLVGGQREKLLGWLRSENVGVDEDVLQICQRVVDTGEVVRVERFIPVLDRWFNVTIFPYGGNRFASLYDDITARKETELQLRHAMTMRDEFLAVLSHELRTPLSAILIWSKMLSAGAVKPEDRAQALAVIEQSAMAQRQLIEDLLDVSSMISGKVRMQMENADLVPVLAATIDAVRPMAEIKHVELVADFKASLWARVDRARLQQVVWNLANNAVKFTPAGGTVTVRLRQSERAARIEVEDTGRGISREFLPHVFERFRQADSSTTRTYGGLGLGLAIARQLVELHGGQIEARSEGEGRGATFIIELPRLQGEPAQSEGYATGAPSTATTTQFVPEPLLTGAKILFVEDETHTRTVVQWLLEQCGAEVTHATSANEALATLDAASNDARSFDALVSDIGLPEKDGYELLAEIRRRTPGLQLPALALTAYAREEDRRKALEAGFGWYLAKPVEPRTLVETVARMITR
jgi:signal transduction histidine kinase/ActR/RegA family two-component response regulator